MSDPLTAVQAAVAVANIADKMGAFGGGGDKGPPAPPPLPGPEPEPTSFTKPAAAKAPGNLQFGPNLTEQQQRTQIATLGSQGSDSTYRDPSVQSYYKNLLQRSLIGDNGQPLDFANVSPVENRYLKDVMGLNYQPRTSSLLQAISNS